MQAARLSRYPWDRLDVVPRSLARKGRAIRGALAETVDVAGLEPALAELLASRVAIVVQRTSETSEVADAGRAVFFETADGAATIAVEPEPALAAAAVGRLLGKPITVAEPFAPLGPAIRGALAALAVEAARRSGSTREIRALSDAPAPSDGLCIEATVLLDDEPYGVRVFAFEHAAPSAGYARAPGLDRLGELPIRLPLVVAASGGSRADLAALVPGDAWLPRSGWFSTMKPSPEGGEATVFALLDGAVLAPPRAEWGVAVGRSEAGQIVLRAGVVGLDGDDRPEEPAGEPTAMNESDDTLEALVLDAPLVVRVEIGAVTLTAREWAGLRPGDVLETGLKLAEPVVLRVAGRAVAEGELVNLDGEIGVRISKVLAASTE